MVQRNTMSKFLKNIIMYSLKTKVINILMLNGKKNTGEQILLKSIKKLQKVNNKQFKTIIHLALINSVHIFKLKEQIVKKGNKKNLKSNVSFIFDDLQRILIAVKSLKKQVLVKHKNLTGNLTNEIIDASKFKGQSLHNKVNFLKKISINRKRYLSKII